ncbi:MULTISPECIES: hypothetical protein [unclassified Paraburkholderia]|uniref:hypothetical protein n=1 Tax=unclassified Paraburkholderia TaxID=2615204 RepID=UPI00197CFB27|nr:MULTISPECIES: hypothetical protein [unclassified Paraburkholderia]MBN3853190.1 hypothetical protein [Paraburkholderia sp. Ac-20340]
MTASTAVGAASGAASSASMVGEMQAMADQNSAMTMASMKINMQQQETSALASVGNNGAKNISDAAKGQ